MDTNTTLTATQAILTSSLLGFLLAWMVTFAVLALRSYAKDAARREESASAYPVVNSAARPLQMMEIPPSTPNPVQASMDGRGNTGEMEVVSLS